MKDFDDEVSIESGSLNLEAMQHAINYNNHLTTLIRANLPPGVSVLDFGAGNGEFALRLKSYGYTPNVLEVESKLCAQLKKLGFQTLQSLEELDDASQSYIYSLNVLEHIQDDVGTLKSIQRKLIPGGTLILYLPAYQILFSEMDRLVGHYRRYKKRALIRILVESGFDIEKIHYCDFVGFFATLLYKMIPKRNGEISIVMLRIYDRMIFPTNYLFDKLFGSSIGKNIFVVARRQLD